MEYQGFTNIQTYLAMQMLAGDRGLHMDCLTAAAAFDDDEAVELIRDQIIARFDFGHSSHEFARVWGTFVDWRQIIMTLRWEEKWRKPGASQSHSEEE